jgi:hypothetical protein
VLGAVTIMSLVSVRAVDAAAVQGWTSRQRPAIAKRSCGQHELGVHGDGEEEHQPRRGCRGEVVVYLDTR